MWQPRQVKPVDKPEIIIKRMEEKDKEVKDERRFKWRNFIFHVVISYELWRANKISQAYDEICSLESVLTNQSNRNDWMFTSIEGALWHVITASKAFLCLERDMVAQAENLIRNVQPVETMRRNDKAGIHGIKAAVFMEYGHRGNKNALVEAQNAVDLDRSNAEWHFFISKCMGRIRRVAQCHENVNPLEVKALNTAVKLDQRNSTYKVFLGQVLSERAFREYKRDYPKQDSEQYTKIQRTNKAAKHRFKEAAELSPNSPHILIRCARGMMKLPPLLKDLKFTKECIDKALELAPNNPMVHHVQAMYHERYDGDADLPIQEYEKAASLGNFGAAMDLVRLHHKLKSTDIMMELESLKETYEQEDKRQVIYVQAGSYLLFIKKDIVGAIKYYLKAMEMNINSYAMMSHKPIFIRMKDPVNMFDVLLEELKTKTDWKSFPPQDVRILRTFRVKAMVHEQKDEPKKRLTVEEILDMSKKCLQDDLYKDAREQRKRRRNFKNSDKNKSGKRWCSKKKATSKEDKKKNTTSTGSEKLRPNLEIKKYERQNICTTAGRERMDSISSVDSDYHRDSTLFGPRKYFSKGSTESLCGAKSDTFGSYRNNINDSSLGLPRESSVQGRYVDHYSRASRDSSISSTSSACSIGFENRQSRPTQMLYPAGSQLTEENLKKLDLENSYDTGIRMLSKLTLSDTSSLSRASSTDTLSVMDRVKQSYAMLGRNNESTQGKKKHFKRHGSTQSLHTQNSADLRNKSGSSLSLNVCEGKPDSKFSKDFKTRDFLGSRESSIGSKRSFSFMPAFACKNSESDLEKS